MKRYIVWGILGVIALVVFSYGLMFMCRPAQVAERITDPDRMIATYEWFFNTYASAKSYASQVKVATEAVETFKKDHASSLDSYANSVELARLREVERGLRNQLISTVNTYNAQAQNKTRGVFKDWDLPPSLTITADGKLVVGY